MFASGRDDNVTEYDNSQNGFLVVPSCRAAVDGGDQRDPSAEPGGLQLVAYH